MATKKTAQKIIAVFCVLFLAMALLPQKIEAASPAPCGRSKLQSATQRYAYDTLVSGMANLSETIHLDAGQKISREDLSLVWDVIRADHPEFIWMHGYSCSIQNGTTVVSVKPQISLNVRGQNVTDISVIRAEVARYQKTVRRIVNSIPGSANTNYKKSLYLHDYVAKNVDYQRSGNDQSAYGALVEGKAVCAGYAAAYQALLNAAGIPAMTVTGTSKGEAHAWNLVWLDGKCCYTDVTWDDQTEGNSALFHYYLNMSLGQIQKDHTFNSRWNGIIPASCGHEGLSYFVMEQGKGVLDASANTAPDALANSMRVDSYNETTHNTVLRCDIRFSSGNFKEWLKKAVPAVAQKYGMNSYRYSYSYIGAEYQLSVFGIAESAITTPVKSVAISPDNATLSRIGEKLQLKATVSPSNAGNQKCSFSSSNPAVARVDAETGVVTAVSSGSAVITVTTADGGKQASCTITVHISEETPATDPVVSPTEPEAETPESAEQPTAPTEAPSDNSAAGNQDSADTPQSPDETVPAEDATNDVPGTGETAPSLPAQIETQNEGSVFEQLWLLLIILLAVAGVLGIAVYVKRTK